ncbi:MAG: glycoside hydrolase family 3 C-terminal domain-containing protein [Dysgonamonadaceae bacterium]|jgi:beta-glucosidase-like glycosyl hydrolase|nr:glycoside hydrolase family 3 C-terminal domain-containing protein [Dysgonamonadaceae bacterium]
MNIKFIFTLIGVSIAVHVSAQFPIVLEAENAKLFGDLKISSVVGFSGGKYAHDFHISSDSYFLYDNVQINEAGTYEIRAYTTGSTRPFSVKVNRYERSLLWSKDSPDWNSPPTNITSAYIYLDAGTNVIKIAAEMENGPNIDKFEIHRTSAVINMPETVKSAFPYSFINDAIITAQHDNVTLRYITDNDESTFYEIDGVTSTTVTVDCKENKLITSMLLSAGRGVAVNNWTVEYSTNGTTWKRLNYASYKLTGMGDLTLFTYTRTPENASVYAARYYRLTATGTSGIRIAEWQLFGIPFVDNNLNFPADITAETNSASRSSAYPQGNTGEEFNKLFDRKMNTKYCSGGQSCYVQYILDRAYRFSSYTVTSANDASERDPKLWSFSGYNPEEGWIELDEQRNFSFPGRYTEMKFNINSEKEFTAFIFEVASVKAGSMLQFSNLQVFGESTGNPACEPKIPVNTSGEPKARASELVQLMTKSEKISYIGGIDWMFTRDIPRLGIRRVKMSDGPQGVGTWGESTAYPCAIMLASTWNEDLAWSYGEALALDCRARGVNILLGPAVNIHRAPMCGRNFEYMGEDPYLASRTATGYIKGLQENGVIATVKHFAANFQEYDRNFVSSDVDERTLNEIYFPAFKAAVQKAGAGCVMSSYNLLNGVWTTHNQWLLKTVLRDQWGFEGILMSDWGSTHACMPAANAGLDLEMAGGERMSPDSLRYFINKNELEINVIDEKVQHILQTIIKFGCMNSDTQQDNSIPKDNPYCAQTALNVAREGIVLLKNQDNILPLKTNTIRKIAVVGENATSYMTGGGSGRVNPFHYVGFYDGIAAWGTKKGIEVKLVDENDLSSMNEADVVIACFGHNADTEAEGGDRSFALPSKQLSLINKVLKTAKPVVGVVTAGGNVEMQSWEPQLKGLLWAWYPGQEGGKALAEILFGDVNPSGKLPVTFEKRWSDNPTYNSYYDTNKHVNFTEGIFMGYRGYDKLNRTVQYPFGYGLSYTTFNLSGITVNETTENNSMLKVTCLLKNTGNMAGAQVIQLYVGKQERSPVERPLKELKAYRKVYLEQGESCEVVIYLSKDAFSYFDVSKTSFVVDEGLYEISLGFSSQDLILKKEITVKNSTGIESGAVNGITLIPSAVKAGELITINLGQASAVNIYDAAGRLKSVCRNTKTISTNGFAPGIYFAHINLDSMKMHSKFIVTE